MSDISLPFPYLLEPSPRPIVSYDPAHSAFREPGSVPVCLQPAWPTVSSHCDKGERGARGALSARLQATQCGACPPQSNKVRTLQIHPGPQEHTCLIVEVLHGRLNRCHGQRRLSCSHRKFWRHLGNCQGLCRVSSRFASPRTTASCLTQHEGLGSLPGPLVLHCTSS